MYKFSLDDLKSCDHEFIRVATNRVECKKCGIGFYDSPGNRFPVKLANQKAPVHKNQENNKHKN